MPSQQSGKQKLSKLKRMRSAIPKRASEFLILLSGIIFTLSATYLSPHYRCAINKLLFGHFCLCQRISYIWNADGCGFSYQWPGITIVTITILTIFLFLVFLFFVRGKDDDTAEESLKEVKSLRGEINTSKEEIIDAIENLGEKMGSGAATTESEVNKGKPNVTNDKKERKHQRRK